jgi:hypothetical protein
MALAIFLTSASAGICSAHPVLERTKVDTCGHSAARIEVLTMRRNSFQWPPAMGGGMRLTTLNLNIEGGSNLYNN